MANIYQNIQKNKNETYFIMFLFTLFITFISWIIGKLFLDGQGYLVAIVAFFVSLFSAFFSYFYSHKIVLSISGAKLANKIDYKDLYQLVENISIASGLPVPKVYIINDSAMNAFATGRNPKNGVICFTTGIILRLDKRELEGVVAHEMAHIGNFDIRLMTIVTVLVGTVALLADWFTHGFFYSRKGSKENGPSALILVLALILIIISPIISTLIKLAISRNREYLADATAAYITRYPQGLANALRKLDNDKEILESANSATAHMYIANPLKNNINQGNFISKIFSTHPPIDERIKRLEQM